MILMVSVLDAIKKIINDYIAKGEIMNKDMEEAIKLLKCLLVVIGNQDNSLNSDEYIVGKIEGIQLSVDTLKDIIKD